MKKILLKSRIKNIYSILTILIVFFLCLFTWLFYSEIIPVLWMYGEDVSCSYWDYVTLMWDELLVWEMFMNSVIYNLFYIFPIFPSFCTIAILRELNSYHAFCAVREENIQSSIKKSVIFHSIWGGIATTFPIALLIYLVDYLMYPDVYSISGVGTLFPNGFYYEHPMIVLLIMVLIYYFPLACSYAIMSIGIALMDRDPVKMLVIPEVWYIFQNRLTIMSKGKIHTDTMDVLAAFNTSLSAGRLYEPIVFQMIISLIICAIGYKINKRRMVGYR